MCKQECTTIVVVAWPLPPVELLEGAATSSSRWEAPSKVPVNAPTS